MEIFGKILNEKGEPLAGASVQRMFPTGETYSYGVVSAANGSFNGRVPDTTYYWIVSAPGYLSIPVSLAGAVTDNVANPIVVQLEVDPAIAAAAVQSAAPVGVAKNDNTPLWIMGGAAAAAVGLYLFGPRTVKVKMKKILK